MEVRDLLPNNIFYILFSLFLSIGAFIIFMELFIYDGKFTRKMLYRQGSSRTFFEDGAVISFKEET